ncbi:MAG: Antidote-toxin recognition MazE, bacterial antitoxin [Clostridia bacterium]|nr:Antidote-toxin recognition MazE, bacterial antitoxin [Clostridia bacterium]
MGVTSLSTKGQVVIPKEIRRALGLRAGTQFRVQLEGEKIVLEKINPNLGSEFYGKYKDVDLLSELREEHKRELRKGI